MTTAERTRVFLAHLGGHHATYLAEALARDSVLTAYATGFCMARKATDEGFSRRFGIRWLNIEAKLLSRNWLLGLLGIVPQRIIPSITRKFWNHTLWWAFGAQAANHRSISDVSVVVCFENSALAVFRRAKRVNPRAARILECPSVHHSAQVYGSLSWLGRRFVARIDAIKAAEIALADGIVVLSDFAKRTFVDAGIPAAKIEVIPLGVNTDFFAESEMPQSRDGVIFLFVGAATHYKGIEVLVEAFKSLPPGLGLLRVAGVRTPLLDQLLQDAPGVVALGSMPHEALRHEYQASHILVLPSLFDGFGLVVTEAMSVGRPVIVSTNVGASGLVATQGRDACGWIVPAGDANALGGAMRAAINARHRLPEMGRAARRVAEGQSWESYAAAALGFYRGASCSRRPDSSPRQSES